MPFNHNQPHMGNGVFTSPYSPWWSGYGLSNSSAPSPAVTFTGQFPPTIPGSFVPANVTYQASGGGTAVVFTPNPDRGWPQPQPLQNYRTFNAVHMALIPKGPYRGHVLVWNNLEVVGVVNPPTVPALAPPPPGQALRTQSYQAYAIIDPADAPQRDIRFRNFLVPTGDELVLPQQTTIANNMFCTGHVWSPYGDLIVTGATGYVQIVPPPPALPYIDYVGGKLVYVFNPRRTCQWPGTSTEYYPSSPSAIPAGSPTGDDYRGLWVRADDLAIARWYPTTTLTHRLVRASVHPQSGTLAGTANQSVRWCSAAA